jgi:ABC-2 type transport system permease protein
LNVTSIRAAQLLLALRLKRLTHQFLFRKPKPGDPRVGTPTRKRAGWFFPLLIGVSLIFTFTRLGFSLVEGLQENLGITFEKGVALQLTLLWFAALLISLVDREIAKPEWDLEWLVTLPIKLRTLLTARILERGAVNQSVLIVLPFLFAFSWHSWHGYLSFLWVLVIGFPLMLIGASVQTVVDTTLKLRLKPGTLRNIQAINSIVGVLLMYLSVSTGKGVSIVSELSHSIPDWWAWSPFGLAIKMIWEGFSPDFYSHFALYLAESAFCVAFAVSVTAFALRNGVVAHSGREMGRRHLVIARATARSNRVRIASQRVAAFSRWARNDDLRKCWLTPIQWRELLLLMRDRNFLVQTMVLPLVMVGGQFYFGAGHTREAFFGHNPRQVAAVVFGISTYALMMSAFQTLTSEGKALWILFCFPKRLEDLLLEKAKLWAALFFVYPVLVLGVFFVLGGRPSMELVTYTGLALFGLVIYTLIAMSLGIFASDPFAENPRRNMKISFIYLYMLLASTYAIALFAGDPWQIGVFVVLTSLLALSLWQKAQDHLPYILDQSALPSSRVSLSDGLIAAMLFFILQTIIFFFTFRHGTIHPRDLFLSFSVAGVLTVAILIFYFYRHETTGVPKFVSRKLSENAWAAVTGILGGALAALIGVTYQRFASALSSESESFERSTWFVLMAVVAAPLCEEFIFRGLIYGGLRRSRTLVTSVLASAGIFAIVHPPFAALPVFFVGIIAALTYELRPILLAPVLVHLIYNAVIIGTAFLS